MKAPALLAGASLALLVTAAACDDATKPPFLPEASPSPAMQATPTAPATPKATATAPATPADLDGFRAFAVHVEEAVRSRDADWFTNMATVVSLVCPMNYPTQSMCEGMPEGTVVRGIQTGGWRSEVQLQPIDEFRSSTAQYLSSLADPTLFAIAAADRDVGGSIGGPAVFAVVVSADDPSNTTRVFEFVEYGGAWSMPLVIYVSNLASEWLNGNCGECYDRWERWEGNP